MSEQEPDPVVVVGDLMLDEAWFGRRDRVCPDAASPVFRVQRRESALGGAARVAKVLVDLGVPVEVVGVIGDDLAGRELLGLLQEHGIGVDGVVVDDHRPTTVKRSHFEGTHARANTK
ncbi:MAG: PfkB family carbohydrate kinase, partial [Planctomycetota bacterium]